MAIRSLVRSTLLTTFSAILVLPLQAQQTGEQAIAAETFIRPPTEIEEAVLAPRHLNVNLGNPSPDGRFFVREQDDGPPTIEMFARPFYRLAGEQIDWQANRSRQWAIRSGIGLEVTDAATGEVTRINVPEGARVSDPEWSPDGSSIAFFVHTENETHIYAADPTNGRSRQITRSPVMATLNNALEWTSDSRSIVTTLLPENRGPAPTKPEVPTGPQVRITTSETNEIRTYPDLLEGPYEKELLEYYSTAQLAVIDVTNRRAQSVGQPAMITSVDVSPDGMYAVVERMRRPFSYIVPRRSFPTIEEIWNLADGTVITVLSEEELDDGSPADTANGDPEPRGFSWRPDGQGISFMQREPRPEGDSARTDEEGEERDRSRRQDHVKQWLPPFDSSSITTVYSSNGQLTNARFSEDAQTLFLTERQGQNVHEYAVFLSDPDTRHTIRRGEGGGGGFGGFGGGTPSIQTKTLSNGVSVVRTSTDGNHVYVAGTEYHDNPMVDGPQSYLNRIEIRTGDSTRIYVSDNNNVYERILTVLDDDATTVLVTRESPTDVRDSFVRSLESGNLRQMTNNTDYTPDITRAQRFRYEVERVDGFKLAVNVTVPENWNRGERLPGMIWFYPREFTDQEDYDESREDYNKNTFPNVGSRSMEILVRRGYAVIQPDAPIVGDDGRMNDNYVHDLRNNLAAVIDYLDEQGIVDRKRLGVGGHSYGAFSTVNAMVHTPFFKAGIAGDGNYNRTLTPFSFQRERRSLWESRDTYFSMSPLFFANNLNGALLMYHGEHDQNVGTFLINSWRLYEALESLGKTSSLYVYPYEDHGPATQETLLDLWGRWSAWLDKYVKGAGEQVTTDDGVAQ
jgi:dipeptidyl aminopeptidase/acylaminoacyl peptidase